MKHASPRFKGHNQPKVPLWGYDDEADPVVMEKKIKVADEYGIDFFIFDWYYYEEHEFLHRALDEGYFNAPNNKDVPFCIMWANHDWRRLMPVKVNDKPDIIWNGDVSIKVFDKMTDLIIEKYFKHPAYYTIDGAPYFSIFSLKTFLRGFNDEDEAARAIAIFREKTIAAGFDDLHLNIVGRGQAFNVETNSEFITGFEQTVKKLGTQSINTYNMVDDKSTENWPKTEYRQGVESAQKFWDAAVDEFSLPYYPTVSMGWDVSPRTVQSDRYLDVGYPFTPIYVNNTPALFKDILERMKEVIDRQSPVQNKHRIGIINAFNEWTEGSYLEPDTIHKYDYLEAVREVFGGK